MAVGIALLAAAPVTQASVTIGGPFTLTAPDGTIVTDKTYRGKWLLVFFGFTSCPDICPTTLFEVAAALEQLGADAAQVQAIFITVDPERDTPEVMGDYVGSFDSRIVGLTGTPQQVAAVAKEYGAYYAPHRLGPGSGDYVMTHGTYLYVMNPRGEFVRAFKNDTPGRDIADALRRSLRD
jgi:protein SCO1/2